MIKHAYIHIPFCIRKCNYCSFVSGYDIKNKDKYIIALSKEIEHRYKGEILDTLYLGGGTPSLLYPEDIERIINLFNINNKTEITIETNPETVTFEKFQGYKKLKINRISLGVQTFDNNLLKIINRPHNEQVIYNAVDIIKKSGFDNISIDLIYGLPNQSLNMFKQDIEKAVKLPIKHISSYGLKIESGSFFGKYPPLDIPNDEIQSSMYIYLSNFLKIKNFFHYEISNFAQKGYESNHNIAYWTNKQYYGFGLNASGYEDSKRYKNQSNFESYIKNPLKKQEEIFLSTNEILEEEIFLALRLKQGIKISEINKKFDIDFEKKYKNILLKYVELNLLNIKNDNCSLTEKGMLLSNEIMADFID